MAGMDGFQPDGLPDAGGAGVPDALAAELLALRLPACALGVGGIVYGNDDLLGSAGLEGVGDIEGEGGVAADVFAQLLAVDPDRRMPIHRAEVEQDAFASPGVRNLERAAIPYMFVDLFALAKAR